MQDEIPETLHAAISFFSQGDNALRIMVAKRWPEGVVCPHCESKAAKFMAKRAAWQCPGCRKQFTVKVGTIFEDSPIKLDKWLSALWLITNAKNGISSCELHRALGVTQKTAWFMLHRIRLAMQNGSFSKVGGEVEVDETFIGGRARLMNAKARAKRKANISAGGSHLTPVQGLLERGKDGKASRVLLKQVANNKTTTLDPNVRKYVLKGSTVNTDELSSYKEIGDEYTHNVINHAECYAKGHVHTNGLENFWSLLKRTIKGTYVSVEPFHLFRYLDEQAFRFNERKEKEGDKGRFLKTLGGILGKRLTYKSLIGDDASDLQTAGAW
jgi:transposase-like protein